MFTFIKALLVRCPLFPRVNIHTEGSVYIQKYHQSTFDTGGVRRVHSELGVQLEQQK